MNEDSYETYKRFFAAAKSGTKIDPVKSFYWQTLNGASPYTPEQKAGAALGIQDAQNGAAMKARVVFEGELDSYK